MKRTISMRKRGIAALALLAGMFTTSAAFAQDPGGPPADPGQGRPPFGGPGGPGMPGRSPFGGPRAMTVMEIPLSVLQSELKLTDDQKSQIKQIQDSFRAQHRNMPRFGGPGGPGGRDDANARPGGPGGPDGGPGGPGGPDGGPGGPGGRDDANGRPGGPGGPGGPEGGRPDPQAMRAAEQKASHSIEAVLDEKQKAKLPALLQTVRAFQVAGLSPELYSQLNLTSDQKQKLANISQKTEKEMRKQMDDARTNGNFNAPREAMQKSRQQTHEKVMGLLTDEQKALVEKYRKEHPQREGGRPPMPGGPQDGNAPPPPGDGGPQDGGTPPPPPGDAGDGGAQR